MPSIDSLPEGAVEATASGDGQPAVSVTGLEALPRDKRTEAIQLLNLQRNRFGTHEHRCHSLGQSGNSG